MILQVKSSWMDLIDCCGKINATEFRGEPACSLFCVGPAWKQGDVWPALRFIPITHYRLRAGGQWFELYDRFEFNDLDYVDDDTHTTHA